MTTRNNTILYFEKSDGENIGIRADEITGIGSYDGKANKLSIFFEGINSTTGGEIQLGGAVNNEKEVAESIVAAINNPKVKHVDVVNPTSGTYVHAALESAGVTSIILNNGNTDTDSNFLENNVDAQNHTLTAANFLAGIVVHTSVTGAGTVTFPTASTIRTAFSPALSTGSIAELIYVNDGNQNVTFAQDAGATVSLRNGSSPTIAANSACKIIFDFTSTTACNAYVLA
jgi:hypothetical protein